MGQWVDLSMLKYIRLFLIVFLLSCDNGKKVKNHNEIIDDNALNKTEAQKLKEELYKKYSTELAINRLQEMKDHIINLI